MKPDYTISIAYMVDGKQASLCGGYNIVWPLWVVLNSPAFVVDNIQPNFCGDIKSRSLTLWISNSVIYISKIIIIIKIVFMANKIVSV